MKARHKRLLERAFPITLTLIIWAFLYWIISDRDFYLSTHGIMLFVLPTLFMLLMSLAERTETKPKPLSEIVTDELCAIRETARKNKNYVLSDQIRNELDSRGCFVMDAPEGQVIYHMGEGWTRKMLLADISWIDRNFEMSARGRGKL